MNKKELLDRLFAVACVHSGPCKCVAQLTPLLPILAIAERAIENGYRYEDGAVVEPS